MLFLTSVGSPLTIDVPVCTCLNRDILHESKGNKTRKTIETDQNAVATEGTWKLFVFLKEKKEK